MNDRTNERQLYERHTHRTTYGHRRFNDGFPEQGTPAYLALSYEGRLRVCERRCGIFRTADDPTDAAPTVTPRPYAAGENNPIDNWR